MSNTERSPLRIYGERFQMSPVGLGAVIGGVVAFVVVGAIVEVLWVLVGVAVGGLVGLAATGLLRKKAVETVELDLADQTVAELRSEAADLGIDGRSHMTKEKLAHAIAEHRGS